MHLLALGLIALSIQGGCVLIPEVVSKVVELVATGTACDTLVAKGRLGVHDDKDFFDFKAGLDLQKVISDAGFDADDIDTILVSGVTYMTTKLDSDPNREIQNGEVTVTRGSGTDSASFVPSGAEVTVIPAPFNVVVNSVTTDQTAPVSAAGINLLNTILAEMLAEAKGGPPVTNTVLRYWVKGISSPTGVRNDFEWRICVTVSIKAPTEVDVIE
jgi:hypothetical protein